MTLARLLERAAGPEPLAAPAREELWRRMLESPADLSAILRGLARASDAARDAAAYWLFSPQSERSWELGLALARAGDEVLALAQARPGPWCRQGLAACLALAGGAALRRLLALARREEWAAQAVAELPPRLRLPGGLDPGQWLASAGLSRAARQTLRRLVAADDWPALAMLGRDELTFAQTVGATWPNALSAPALAWSGGDLALLDQVAAITAREGRIAVDLAQAISRQERRPVLLVGNASLGGPPLWAVPGPWERGWGDLRPTARPPASALESLAWLRARRLAAPGLRHALWEFSCAVALRGQGRRELALMLDQAGEWLTLGDAQRILDGSLPLALGELPLAQARERARIALARMEDVVAQGRRALALLHGLAGAAGRLPRGKALVLPWIDKVVASTGKAADHVFLAELTALLARLSPPPLLLLVDETIHPAASSLKVVLDAAGRLGPELVLRGLGCFGGEAEPGDPRAAALAAARDAHVLALRAAPGPHPVAVLDERLAGRAMSRPLSPASRDGADYLLAGTALADLTGESQAGGGPAPWLLTASGFAPLGAWLRNRVRSESKCQELPPGQAGRFWRAYQAAANLG